MNDKEAQRLAREYAADNGYESRSGGWIYNQYGQPVAQGWRAFAELLGIRKRNTTQADR